MIALAALLIASAAARAEPVPGSEEEVKKLATTYMTGILNAMKEFHYQKYVKHFGPVMKRASTEKVFDHTCEKIGQNIGQCQSVKCLGFVNQAGFTIVFFKARFSKEPDDALIKLVLAQQDEKAVVSGLWFDSPKLRKARLGR